MKKPFKAKYLLLLPFLLTFQIIGCKKDKFSNAENLLSSSTNRLKISKSQFDKMYVKLKSTDNSLILKQSKSIIHSSDFVSLLDPQSKLSKTALSLKSSSSLLSTNRRNPTMSLNDKKVSVLGPPIVGPTVPGMNLLPMMKLYMN